MKKITQKEIKEFLKTYGETDAEMGEGQVEWAINMGYVWIDKYERWVNKDNSFYTNRDEEILDYLRFS